MKQSTVLTALVSAAALLSGVSPLAHARNYPLSPPAVSSIC
jgi:hypothetical protein